MNNRYILIAVLALVPAGMKGMDVEADFKGKAAKVLADALTNRGDNQNPDFSFASDTTGGFSHNAPVANWEKASARLSQKLDGLNKNAKYFNSSEPSFLSKFGNQCALGIAMLLGSTLASHIVLKYLTTKAVLDRAEKQETLTEQTILNNYVTEVGRVANKLQYLKNQLTVVTNPQDIENLNAAIKETEEELQETMATHAACSEEFRKRQAARHRQAAQENKAAVGKPA